MIEESKRKLTQLNWRTSIFLFCLRWGKKRARKDGVTTMIGRFANCKLWIGGTFLLRRRSSCRSLSLAMGFVDQHYIAACTKFLFPHMCAEGCAVTIGVPKQAFSLTWQHFPVVWDAATKLLCWSGQRCPDRRVCLAVQFHTHTLSLFSPSSIFVFCFFSLSKV